MLTLKRLILIGDDYVNEGIGEQNHVEVTQITFKFVIEGDGAEREVYLFTSADWLFRENDLLDLLINVDKNLNVARVQKLVLIEKRLKFEETQLLHTLRRVDIEDLFDDLNCRVKRVFDLVSVCASWCASTHSLTGSSRLQVGRAHSPSGPILGLLRLFSLQLILLSQKVTQRSILCQDCGGEFEALGFDFPKILICK